MIANIEQLHCFEDGANNFTYPCAYHTLDEKDTLKYGEMLQASDRPHSVQAMLLEMEGLKDMLHVCCHSILPAGTKPLPAV
jgi:hypothetical protein